MIIRRDDVWTTIQCKNLVSDDGKLCNLCFKVLNDRFALTQQCPYCLGKINLRPWLKEKPKAAAASVEDAGVILWKESGDGHTKRHFIKED